MRWARLWIGFAVVAAIGVASGCFDARIGRARLHTRSMPGFEIDVPEGEVEKAGSDYGRGRLSTSMPAEVFVDWQAGGLSDDEEIALTSKAFGAVLHGEAHALSPAPTAAIEGRQTRSWAVRIGNLTSWTTETVCGTRRVSVRTLGNGMGIELLHRRVAASFRCHPDPSKEVNVVDVPVVFDLGPGWSRTPSKFDSLLLTNRRVWVTATRFNGLMDASKAEKILTVAPIMPDFKLHERDGDDWPFDGTLDGRLRHGWTTVLRCPDSNQTIWILAVPIADGKDDTRALLAHARCRKPGEPAQTWPEMPRQPAK